MKEVFENRAEVQGVEKNIACGYCDNPILFAMQDKHHKFSLDLVTVLKCLRLAEQEFAIPPLPDDWWVEIDKRYWLKHEMGVLWKD